MTSLSLTHSGCPEELTTHRCNSAQPVTPWSLGVVPEPRRTVFDEDNQRDISDQRRGDRGVEVITATRFAYRFGDITVVSEVELQGLVRAGEGDTPDVTVRLRSTCVLDDCTELGRVQVSPDGTIVMDMPPVARFRLSTARAEIVLEPLPAANVSALRHVVVDLALPRWFAARGRPALHATAVELDGGVAAFLGASGQGKSTLSGAMVASGATWVADDLLLLDLDGPQVVAVPTVVSTRLRADSAMALGIDPNDGEVILSPNAKRRWDVQTFAPAAPVACMFVVDRRLETDGPVTITPLSSGDALKELADHWLLTGTGVISPLNFFASATVLLRSTRIVRLSFPSSFEALPGVVAAVRHEIAEALRSAQDLAGSRASSSHLRVLPALATTALLLQNHAAGPTDLRSTRTQRPCSG